MQLDQGNVVIDFYAPWCNPCKSMEWIFNALKEDFKDQNIQFEKLNIEEHEDLVQRFGIRSIPTFITLKDGKEVQRATGSQTREALTSMVRALV